MAACSNQTAKQEMTLSPFTKFVEKLQIFDDFFDQRVQSQFSITNFSLATMFFMAFKLLFFLLKKKNNKFVMFTFPVSR